MKLQRVTLSGINTYKLPVISSEETQKLFERLEQGDEQAKQELINGNLRLVLSVINKFKNRGENLDDLFQVGCLGLVKAVDNFDPKQGVKFSTYAVPMIMGEIKRYLRDDSPMRVSRSLKLLGQEAAKAKEKLRKEKPYEPTIEELASELNISREELVEALNSSSEPLSLYDPVYSDSTDPVLLVDQIKDEEERLENWVENMTLKEAIAKLPERQRNIVNRRFFKGQTQVEVSDELNISQAQVSRLEKSALLQLRKLVKEEVAANREGRSNQDD
ncbi:RNA polymerase sporulation sigma factor SigG [Natranaerobius thermophilus]|uniref:RNA polymerase sigma factor n=1 Tax=Natranaerobius thermophilus (strain ATCC BAA-1301 / DSM 18059 / JW/NM-WN-LF) TaxID=457570 RepID=B2A3I8_NATTJ|nr:RNA polymerase sporulation sigma factor SigG [Natranaerobius thermophilus]ACB86417.1 RNA polymerase, sigma 28 subunit, FliA/WhiG family [Natranaerobius thermophilus JW/NM-WN-LF]